MCSRSYTKSSMSGVFVGLSFQPSLSLLESCRVVFYASLVSHILAECVYSSDSMATGFQMMAQLSDSNTVHVDKAVNRQSLASVVVEESGTYQVTIFAIRGERGIVESNVEYMELVVVEELVTTTLIPATSITGRG